jgi:hypothetical protein
MGATPGSAAKEEEKQQSKRVWTVEEVWQQEMGVSLVIQAMIKHKKPILGHNCMYDWVYVYN